MVLQRYFSVLLLGYALCLEPLAADGLGRLFTRPSDRFALDQLRYAEKVTPKPETPVIVEEEPASPKQAPVHLHGIISRPGKQPIIWMNGVSTLENPNLLEQADIRPKDIQTDRLQLKLPDESIITIKAGEVFTPKLKTDSD